MVWIRNLMVGSALAAGSLIDARGDVRLPALFSDNLVLQQDFADPIWGRAEPGEAVTVEIARQAQRAVADATGHWKIVLAPMPATNAALTLTVRGRNTVVVQNVLIGEVWLCSGQSNMEMQVFRAQGYAAEKPRGNLPGLRVFTVSRASTAVPQEECGGRWVVSTAQSIGNFSATAYYFGSTLHRRIGRPVGLIKSAWGSTLIEAWTSPRANDRLDLAAILARSGPSVPPNPPPPPKPGKSAPPPSPPILPGSLFNGMIAPLIPYALRGVVWYQGEANSRTPHAGSYGRQLAALIGDWRERWGAELPFAWVQLPNYRAPQSRPSEPSGWVTVREEMRHTLRLPQTGMAIALGLGQADLIHPTAKREVGERLAAWALSDVYHAAGAVGSGPLPGQVRFAGHQLIIPFEHTEGGLTAHGGEVRGFAVAGPDRQWRWATARIEGRAVVVSSPEVPVPAAVRYAWADNPQFSLWNGAGLPASPFRSDDWPDG